MFIIECKIKINSFIILKIRISSERRKKKNNQLIFDLEIEYELNTLWVSVCLSSK